MMLACCVIFTKTTMVSWMLLKLQFIYQPLYQFMESYFPLIMTIFSIHLQNFFCVSYFSSSTKLKNSLSSNFSLNKHIYISTVSERLFALDTILLLYTYSLSADKVNFKIIQFSLSSIKY